jgi:neutral amino acid transport system permease protein
MDTYIVFLTISAATYAIFSMGLNLQWGVAGLINFGHVAFLAVGAYTTVLLSMGGVPMLIAVLCGGVLAAILGLLIGISTLRLREDYLGIVTIGVSELVRLVAKNESWLTKGAFGVHGYPQPLNINLNYPSRLAAIVWLTVLLGWVLWQLWQWSKNKSQPLFGTIVGAIFAFVVYIYGSLALYNYTQRAGLMLITLTTLAIVYIGLEKLVHSPWGRILKAIREDEEVPKALGKNIFWYKLQAFMLGGAIAGLAGAFYAWQFNSVYPDNFEPLITFNAWIIVMLGGAGNNLGAIVGAIIFWSYSEFTRTDLFKSLFKAMAIDEPRQGALRIMIIGAILMLLMILRPQGILGKKEELTLGK